MTAAGLLGAPSKAELAAYPSLQGKAALRTQVIFKGAEYHKKGKKQGEPVFSACPKDLFSDYPQFTVAQTPSHFAKFSSTVLYFQECLVPYYEKKIEEPRRAQGILILLQTGTFSGAAPYFGKNVLSILESDLK